MAASSANPRTPQKPTSERSTTRSAGWWSNAVITAAHPRGRVSMSRSAANRTTTMLPTGPASMPRLQQDTVPSSRSCVLGVVEPAVELSPLARARPSRIDTADPRVRLDRLVARFVAGVWDNPIDSTHRHHVQRPQRDGRQTAALSSSEDAGSRSRRDDGMVRRQEPEGRHRPPHSRRTRTAPRPPWRAWLQHENGHPALPCDSIGFSRCKFGLDPTGLL